MAAINMRRSTIFVVSFFLNPNPSRARKCPSCPATWTCEHDNNDESYHVRKDGQLADDAVLDWNGNNAAVECCHKVEIPQD
jgi:hypothetical protein